jgi:Tol biopolymer transport system component
MRMYACIGHPGKETAVDAPKLRHGQIAQVLIASTTGEPSIEVFSTDEMIIEAPNWTLDGRWLILNGDGKLWRLAADGSSGLEQIELSGVPALNNDHVLAPDGRRVFVSANDWHIYEADLNGGPVRRVTNDHEMPFMHFLHGVSPDGETLAYVGLEPEEDNWWARANIFLIPAAGGPDRRLTDEWAPFDGCEFSPDGEWIYCNTELFSDAPGHAQIARLRPDGTDLQQLTFDERVDWFPHISPDGNQVLFVSFPPGTTGHPANLPVELKLVRDGNWDTIETLIQTFGGQGTCNVNSWAPDSTRFAYVSYAIRHQS